MQKIIILFFILVLTLSDVYAYALKVYDEYGNRVGTYRKEGDKYEFYDFYDKKVDNPEALIQNAPEQKTLTQYSRTFYDENMMPIGTWHSGYYGNNGRYYPLRGEFMPSAWARTNTPHIVRPRANSRLSNHVNYNNSINYIDTRYPRFHKFK